jgi:two-component system, response regulator, stage 0 sporulation protein F
MATVLIVEDEQPLSMAYQTILEKHGFRALAATNGEEALAVLQTDKPDLILLDMMMPKMNGLEFLRRLQGTFPADKVIVFSNQDSQEDIDEAFRLGANRYLLKSWAAPQDLVKVVKEALAS